jgi:hypothetical protein
MRLLPETRGKNSFHEASFACGGPAFAACRLALAAPALRVRCLSACFRFRLSPLPNGSSGELPGASPATFRDCQLPFCAAHSSERSLARFRRRICKNDIFAPPWQAPSWLSPSNFRVFWQIPPAIPPPSPPPCRDFNKATPSFFAASWIPTPKSLTCKNFSWHTGSFSSRTMSGHRNCTLCTRFAGFSRRPRTPCQQSPLRNEARFATPEHRNVRPAAGQRPLVDVLRMASQILHFLHFLRFFPGAVTATAAGCRSVACPGSAEFFGSARGGPNFG